MKKERKLFWTSVQPFVGSVIGVGIFGLPFVFARAGFGIAIIHLVILAVINTILLLLFADIIKNTDGHPRFAGVVERYLGKGWGWFATIIIFASVWGALLAYIIIGGEFLFALFEPLIGGSITMYQLVFYLISAFLVIGGLGFVAKLESAFVFVLLILLGFVLIGSVPHVDISNLTYVNGDYWFLPFGVVLFAFGGLSAIPEMAQVLGRYKKKLLRKAIIIGVIIVAIVYVLFSGIVTGVSGINTTDEAIRGLGVVVGDWALVLGSVIGLFSVFTSFLILALSVMDTMIYDYRQRYFTGWFIAIIVPFILFIIGARSFIGVIGFVGGVLTGLAGLLVIYTYIKAKKDVCTPKRCLNVPYWVLVIAALVFIFGIVVTIIGV